MFNFPQSLNIQLNLIDLANNVYSVNIYKSIAKYKIIVIINEIDYYFLTKPSSLLIRE